MHYPPQHYPPKTLKVGHDSVALMFEGATVEALFGMVLVHASLRPMSPNINCTAPTQAFRTTDLRLRHFVDGHLTTSEDYRTSSGVRCSCSKFICTKSHVP